MNPLREVIEDVMKEVKEDINTTLNTKTIVCMDCFVLLERLDELQEQIKTIKEEVGSIRLQIQLKMTQPQSSRRGDDVSFIFFDSTCSL